MASSSSSGGSSSSRSSGGSGGSGRSSDKQDKTDKALENERTPEGLQEDPNTGEQVPEGNAPGPSYEEAPTVSAVDLRPRIEPRDRATYLGAVHKRSEDVDVPDDFNVFGDSDGERDAETVELDAKPVDVFQIIGTNQELILRLDGQSFMLNAEQSRGFSVDLHGVTSNVVT